MVTCAFHPQRETGRSCTRCGRAACPECLRDAPVGSHCVACVKEAQPKVAETMARQAHQLKAIRPSPVFFVIVAVAVGGGVLSYLADSVAARGGTDFRQVAVFILVLAGWVVSLCLHEFGHALVAYLGGDHTVASKGYLTLDVRRYADRGLSLFLPLVFLALGGIGLPGGAVWINQGLIHDRRVRTLVSLAGPAANVVFGSVLLAPFWTGVLDYRNHPTLAGGLAFLGYLQFFAAILNMLPVPGLDGFGALEPWLPGHVLEAVAPFRQYGFLILFVMISRVDAIHRFLTDGATRALESLQVRPSRLWALGYALFKFWQRI